MYNMGVAGAIQTLLDLVCGTLARAVGITAIHAILPHDCMEHSA